jgi:hypothetical protein
MTNGALQLDTFKNDQIVEKEYIKAIIKCIKFQGRQYYNTLYPDTIIE